LNTANISVDTRNFSSDTPDIGMDKVKSFSDLEEVLIRRKASGYLCENFS